MKVTRQLIPRTRNSTTSDAPKPRIFYKLPDEPSIDGLFPLPKEILRERGLLRTQDPQNKLWYLPPSAKTQNHEGEFCDWLSIYQDHGGDLPKLSDGAFMRIDADGEVVSTTLKKLRIEGSFDTSIYIRCDGGTVWFEGNVSKFERQDNLFGFTFSDCISRINQILAKNDLPPFSAGKRFEVNPKTGFKHIWTGAKITRLDMTQNFCTGSKENSYQFMRLLSAQQAARLKTGTYGDGETVDFGRGSRSVYSKAYLKGPEVRRHIKKNKNALAEGEIHQYPDLVKPFDEESNEYLLNLANWCDEVGLVRFETTYKSTFLHNTGNHYLGGFDMGQLLLDFEGRKSILTRISESVEDVSSLPVKTLGVYRMWQKGDDLSEKFKKTALYKHRKILLEYGVDISVKSNVIPFEPKTRVIKLGPISPPDFYKLPELTRFVA